MEKIQANILIIEDEPVPMEQSRQMVSLYINPDGNHTAFNSVEVMRILQSVPIDLAFVDIEMPDNDGFTTAGYIQSTQPKANYVFLTGHTELGAKSYDYEPLDFLCKPLNALRLQKTFQRFEKIPHAEPGLSGTDRCREFQQFCIGFPCGNQLHHPREPKNCPLLQKTELYRKNDFGRTGADFQ